MLIAGVTAPSMAIYMVLKVLNLWYASPPFPWLDILKEGRENRWRNSFEGTLENGSLASLIELVLCAKQRI